MIHFALAALVLLQPVGETFSLRAVIADEKGVAIRDLEPGDVSLTVDGASLTPSRFEKDERPARVALVLDSSQPMSTAYRLQFMDAARAFIASLPSKTRVNVWATGDRPQKVIDDLNLEEDGTAKEVTSRLSRVATTGGNTLLDALVEAAEDLQKKEGERNIVVFLSGMGPGFANDTREGIVDQVMKTGVEVAGVLISEGGASSGGGDVSQEDYDYVTGVLTDRTAGRLERPLSVMGAGLALQRVAADLRSTYRLAYSYTGAGRRPKVALQVARPKVKVRLSTPQKETSSP